MHGSYLADDVPVGETDNHPILGCVVFVFVLDNKALPSKEVRLALLSKAKTPTYEWTVKIEIAVLLKLSFLTSPSPKLDLVPLKVGLVLDNFNKTLKRDENIKKKQDLEHSVYTEP